MWRSQGAAQILSKASYKLAHRNALSRVSLIKESSSVVLNEKDQKEKDQKIVALIKESAEEGEAAVKNSYVLKL